MVNSEWKQKNAKYAAGIKNGEIAGNAEVKEILIMIVVRIVAAVLIQNLMSRAIFAAAKADIYFARSASRKINFVIPAKAGIQGGKIMSKRQTNYKPGYVPDKPTPPPPPPMRVIREGYGFGKSKRVFSLTNKKEEVMSNKKFNLNQEVKDVVTGFKGIIMGITEYNTGCIQYGVCPQKLDKDGKTPDWLWLDGSRLSATGKSVNIKPAIGGPHPSAPQM